MIDAMFEYITLTIQTYKWLCQKGIIFMRTRKNLKYFAENRFQIMGYF